MLPLEFCKHREIFGIKKGHFRMIKGINDNGGDTFFIRRWFHFYTFGCSKKMNDKFCDIVSKKMWFYRFTSVCE